MEYDGSAVGARDRETSQVALELPSYADSIRPANLPGFSNPQYSVEGGRVEEEEAEGEEEEERREGEEDFEPDDLPPPYSPGGFGQRDVFVAPPEYFAIFGQIREAREESSNHFVFLRKLCQIFLNTIGCTVLLLIFMSIPIAVLALGIYFIDECRAEPNIPIFLVVGGVCGALKNIALVFENIVKRMSHRFSIESVRRLRYAKFTWRVVNLIFDLFLMAWIIAGSYWIYHIYNEVDPDYDNCNETLYKFAFGVITSSYIIFAMMCCCMCVCGLCLLPRRTEESERGGEEEGEGGGESSRGGSHSPTPHSNREDSLPPPHLTGETTSDRATSVSENGEMVEPLFPAEGRGGSSRRGGGRGRSEEIELRDVPTTASTVTPDDPGSHGDGGGRGQLNQQTLSLNDLEPLDLEEYEQTPVLSPRARQLVTNEQGQPLSSRTTSV